MKEIAMKLDTLISRLDLLVGTLPETTLLDRDEAPLVGDVLLVDDIAYNEFTEILKGLEDVEESLKDAVDKS